MTEAPTLTVSVELPPAVTDAGLRLAVTPAGAPLTDRLTVSAEPEIKAVLIDEVPEPPWAKVRDVGLALIEKSLTTGAVTVSETVAEWEPDEAEPVTVRV